MKSTKQISGCLPKGYYLDSLLTVAQFAKWRQSPLRKVMKQIRAGLVPVIEHSREDRRIHPRTYLERTIKK